MVALQQLISEPATCNPESFRVGPIASPRRVRPVADKMAVLLSGLRKFRWEKPEQFAGGAPVIYLQQRYAGLR